MTSLRVWSSVLGAMAGLAIGAAAFGQNIGPSLGTVELRWRERSTAGYNGSYTLGPGATAGVDVVPTPDPSAASVTAQDASVVLVLEARVTPAAGITGPGIRGLRVASMNIKTNQTSGGAFGRQDVPDGVSVVNPRANARVNATNLGFDPATLLDYPASGVVRGLVSPFRETALNAGGLNGPGLGHFRTGNNTIHKIEPALQTANLNPANPDATNRGQYALAGLNAWVPLCIVVYNITDVTTARDIVFTATNVDGVPQITDYGFRTWRGSANTQNGDLDLWSLSPGFTTPPTFTVHVVPGPGAAGVLALGCGVALRRRMRV